MMNIPKILFFSLLIFIVSNNYISAQQPDAFQSYRFNPFLFPYPEYGYTPEQILIDKTDQSENNSKTVDCFGVSISFPIEIAERVEKKSKSQILIRSKKNMAIVVNFENENLMGCIDESERDKNRDFCSAFTSTEDFFDKLFTLTPEDLLNDKYSSTGFKWIVHRKGHMFNRVSGLMIYKANNYSVYRTDIKDEKMSIKSELYIFHESIKPDYLIINMNFKDDKIIKAIVSSIN